MNSSRFEGFWSSRSPLPILTVKLLLFMPCSDSVPNWSELEKRNEHLAQMLCGLMRKIEEIDSRPLSVNDYDSIPGLAEWWQQHKAHDAGR